MATREANAGSNPQSPPAEGSWRGVLDAVVPAVVALQVTAVRSFQDDHAGAHGGTGFVVDAARGLLLTNRHVCTCGPERASATFVGYPAMEEVPVRIVYVDPVHDFALLSFDPTLLKQTPHTEIQLDPAGCRVGEEIRVVGNDSLEKLQILSGTIARVDRNPPDLAGDYHDENTFYALAASGTRGGSSGSPVLNRHGAAVALNAAATGGTMHGFYLPLHRVARALEAMRKGDPVPRGTLCTAFIHASFPECLRLGVTNEFAQHKVLEREPPAGGTFSKSNPSGGMLQVRRCVPGTPAACALQPGDVLLELEGEPCADFVFLDALLDNAVGKTVHLALCRGGERVEVDLAVQDLHSLIPHSFIELGMGVFHGVPYQTAQKNHVPLEGVYVAQAGFVFGEAVRTDAVIVEINGTPCPDLCAFEELLQQIPNGEYFNVTSFVPKNVTERRRCESQVKMQRHWCTFRAWSLDVKTRTWSPRPLDNFIGAPVTPPVTSTDYNADCLTPPPPAGPQSATSSHDNADVAIAPAKRARKNKRVGALAALEKSLVSVTFRTCQSFDLDLLLDVESLETDVVSCRGAGIVVDPSAGLILTDRVTVPQPLGDIEVTLGEVSRSASVWFMHPLHSLVVLRLDDVAQAGGPQAFGVAASFDAHSLDEGDECDFVGVDVQGRRVVSQVKIQAVRMGDFPTPYPPRWHERNLEAVVLGGQPAGVNSGVLCNAQGHIYALYAVATAQNDEQRVRLGYGIPTCTMMPLLNHLRGPGGTTVEPAVPSLELELKQAELPKLRRLPPSLRPAAQWLAKLGAQGEGKSALQISGITSGGPCDGLVAVGDLLVAVCGEVVTTIPAIESKLQECVAKGCSQEVGLTLLRRGKERNVVVSVPLLRSDGARRIVCWHGLVLQSTPRAVRQFGKVPAGVHICQTMLGSPGEADGIEGEFLLSVDGVPTPTLDSVMALAHGAGQGTCSGQTHMRLETADLSGQRFMKTMRPDPLFWPMFEMLQNSSTGSWSCEERSDS